MKKNIDPIEPKKIPTPSEDFPTITQDMKPFEPVDISNDNNFEYFNPTPEDTPPLNLTALNDPDISFDFATPEEIAEAVKRNEELASNGFKLSNTEDEHLRPKLYDEDDGGTQLNSIACTVGEDEEDSPLEDTERVTLSSKWDDFGVGVRGCSETFKPRADDDNHWKRLYFAQKGITGQLEKIIEEML